MACMGLSIQAFPQSNAAGSRGYYVVVNAYAKTQEERANNYFEQLRSEGSEAHYSYIPEKHMYFVYTKQHDDFEEAIADMLQTRKDPRFSKAWVYVCNSEAEIQESTTLPVTVETGNENLPASAGNKDAVLVASASEAQIDHDAMEELNDRLEPPANIKQLVFILSNAQNNREVRGNVEIVDAERARLIGVQNSGEIRAVKDPENGTGQISLICDVFGFRKEQKEVNYYGLDEHEDIQRLDDYHVVFFDLVRYYKGDIATMYNVYFFKVAAIMKPESRYEMNSLLEMMRENPDYRIRIHGHTNGKRRGKIIAMGDSGNFFSLKDDNREVSGSARMLSRFRAGAIRDYLISQGIDANRMEVKAWGGRRMLYDKNSSSARKNVRVEIEILED